MVDNASHPVNGGQMVSTERSSYLNNKSTTVMGRLHSYWNHSAKVSTLISDLYESKECVLFPLKTKNEVFTKV